MKFILHNLRMIWARLSNSGWVVILIAVTDGSWPNFFWYSS